MCNFFYYTCVELLIIYLKSYPLSLKAYSFYACCLLTVVYKIIILQCLSKTKKRNNSVDYGVMHFWKPCH